MRNGIISWSIWPIGKLKRVQSSRDGGAYVFYKYCLFQPRLSIKHTCSNISVKLHYIHCKKNYILKNRGNWQINIGSTSCFPKIFPKQKCIVVILAEGLKLKLKNICSLNISNCAQPIYQAEVKNMYCWPNKLCSKKVCTHAPEKKPLAIL